jgi:hypothetical protein
VEEAKQKKILSYFTAFFRSTTNHEELEAFSKKYSHVLQTKFFWPKSQVLSTIKEQKVLKRKKYRHVASYKWQKLHVPKKSKCWDFFEQRKVHERGSCYFLNSHSKKIYTLKRAFRFFYGHLKSNI